MQFRSAVQITPKTVSMAFPSQSTQSIYTPHEGLIESQLTLNAAIMSSMLRLGFNQSPCPARRRKRGNGCFHARMRRPIIKEHHARWCCR
jgi:hypothetical protein